MVDLGCPRWPGGRYAPMGWDGMLQKRKRNSEREGKEGREDEDEDEDEDRNDDNGEKKSGREEAEGRARVTWEPPPSSGVQSPEA